jgi:hypothetical protein
MDAGSSGANRAGQFVRVQEKALAMNRYERRPIAASEAQVLYQDGDYRVLRPGLFVLCAVTGVQIPLDELRYWSVERQEAYANAQASVARTGGKAP